MNEPAASPATDPTDPARTGQGARFAVRAARSEAEAEAASRLRYAVFVDELGGDGPQVDHAARLERDRFDAFCDQLLLIDRAEGDRVIGTYRTMDAAQAARAGGFYSETEYDLAPLYRDGRAMMEFGRSCLAPEYRGGPAMHAMWSHILHMVRARGVALLFGVGSFPGTDPGALAAPLSILHHRHRTPAPLRPEARPPGAVSMDLTPGDRLDRKAAMRAMPALIKAYLRLGAAVGEGAWIDHDFGCTDVFLLLDMDRLNTRQARLYERPLT